MRKNKLSKKLIINRAILLVLKRTKIKVYLKGKFFFVQDIIGIVTNSKSNIIF